MMTVRQISDLLNASAALAEGVKALVGDMPSAEFDSLGEVCIERMYALCDLANQVLMAQGRGDLVPNVAGDWTHPRDSQIANGGNA